MEATSEIGTGFTDLQTCEVGIASLLGTHKHQAFPANNQSKIIVRICAGKPKQALVAIFKRKGRAPLKRPALLLFCSCVLMC